MFVADCCDRVFSCLGLLEFGATIAVGLPVARQPPARIPAGGITAPGSSEVLASAKDSNSSISLVCYRLQGGLHINLALRVQWGVSFASYVLLSAPSLCDRHYRLKVLWADLPPDGHRLLYLMFRFGLPAFWVRWIPSQCTPRCRNLSGLPSS